MNQSVPRRYRASVRLVEVLALAMLAASTAAALSFGDRQALAGDGRATALATADFDRDGRMDVAAAFDTDDVWVFLSRASGDPTRVGPLRPGASPSALLAVDVTGDARPDLIATNQLDNTVVLLAGRGDGTFEVPRVVGSLSAPAGVAAGDFNRDGRVDLAVVSRYDDTLVVLRGETGGGFTAGDPIAVAGGPIGVASGDLDRNGALDLVVTVNIADSAAWIVLGQRDGSFATPVRVATGAIPGPPLLRELTGDDALDLAVAATGDDAIALLRGRGDGAFDPVTLLPVGAFPAAVAAADLDHDGRLDLISADCFDDTLSVLRGSDGGFAGADSVATGAMPIAVAAADVDRSRVPDLISLDALAGGASLFRSAIDPGPVCLGDCNDDGVVAIDDLVRGVGIAVSQTSVAECLPADPDANAEITINELIAAVRSALSGC